MENIFADAKQRLQVLIKSEETKPKSFPKIDTWFEYKAGRSGYFQNISIDNVLSIAEEENTRIYIVVPKGLFVLSNAVFIKSEKPLKDEVVKAIFSNISFARGELVEDNYLLAFKQITEIAVKAMSPGINDPGTAINAIDYLTELFALRIQKRDEVLIMYKEEVRLKIAVIRFHELLYNVMASLRTYCKHDPVMVQKLLWMLQYLITQPVVEDSYTTLIKTQIDTLLKHAKDSFDSVDDIAMLEKMVTH